MSVAPNVTRTYRDSLHIFTIFACVYFKNFYLLPYIHVNSLKEKGEGRKTEPKLKVLDETKEVG